MINTMTNPPTPNYEWQEGGMELLREPSEAYKSQFFDKYMPNYECKKKDCWFCEMMGLRVTEINPYLKRPVVKHTEKYAKEVPMRYKSSTGSIKVITNYRIK